MLVSCPACAARYRLDPARFAGKRISIRCPACQFVFAFPRDRQVADQGPEVLIATGNLPLIDALTERCRQSQLACRVCSDGTDAIRLMTSRLPSIVLLDVSLTGRYAFDVIQWVRNQTVGNEVRILLLISSFRRNSFIAKTSELHGANDSIDGEVLSSMSATEFRSFLLASSPAPISCEPEPNPLPEVSLSLWNQASILAKVIAADMVLRYQDLLEESARTGVLDKALVEGLAKGRQLFSSRMGVELSVNHDFVGAALAACLQGRSGGDES